MTRRTFPALTGRRAARTLAFASIGLVLASSLGLGALASPVQAAGETDSEVTVKWAGENDAALQQYQPDHAGLLSDGAGNDAGSGHWDDFKNLEVTVSKTKNLGDGVVTVTATGLRPTVYSDWNPRNALSNYLQIMQCWGPDPLAADFYETCQFGANFEETKGVRELLGAAPAGRGSRPIVDVANGQDTTQFPFRAVTGDVSKPYYSAPTPEEPRRGEFRNGLDALFTPSTSNELPFVPVTPDGIARTGFETQSAAAQPYLGCGDADLAGERCWLVVVPRGIHSGEWPADQSTGYTCGTRAFEVLPYGDVMPTLQRGSPLSPDCTFFRDRIVIPLDFDEVGAGCAPGTAERRVIGSELAAATFSSWQQGLCVGTEARAYSLSTNAGDLTRSQLLTGQADLAVVSEPLTPDTIGTTNADLLADADLAYGPIANTGLAIGFYIGNETGQEWRDIRLTPRLLAKLLTQSYQSQVPSVTRSHESESFDNRTTYTVALDPEWIALGNPKFHYTPGYFVDFVTPGPHGDDSIRMLWEYIQADADAAAFLRGEADPWGMTVNPYYLPAGHQGAADGGLPYNLSTDPIDVFPRADQSLAPIAADAALYHRGIQIDSITHNPYSTNLETNGTRVFRTDTRRTQLWDPNKWSGAAGAWVPEPVGVPGTNRTIMGPTTAHTANEYRLNVASVALPLSTKTTIENVAGARNFVGLSQDSLAAAAAATVTDGATGLSQLEFASLPANAYPLTSTLNAAVNLASAKLTPEARSDYARLLEFAATEGQVSGEAPGQLPSGYAPLTESQRAATQALAAELVAAAASEPDAEAQVPGGAGSGARTVAAAGTQTAASDPAAQTQVTDSAALEIEVTAAASAPMQTVLGATLLGGLAGLATAPFLLRRRGVGG
ncbi:hypothetical protein [Salinibacterium sp. ZJ454]|uniref:hypothetical protein n=1 Tax=Salinibacterium sp. ZJ454 TaxID=2708339 RepID=UPI001421E803|nr:hypothetical protein [Salinibacterium sp. ZJ454]